MKPDFKIQTERDLEHYAYQLIRTFDVDTRKNDYHKLIDGLKIVWNQAVEACAESAILQYKNKSNSRSLEIDRQSILKNKI